MDSLTLHLLEQDHGARREGSREGDCYSPNDLNAVKHFFLRFATTGFMPVGR
jgi:hypothetical protein